MSAGRRRRRQALAAREMARLRQSGDTIKCISVVQPWAALIVLGAKRYEARNWSTRYRGPLAIHASGRFPEFARVLCREEPFRSLLRRAGVRSWFDVPAGVLLGMVRLVACVPAKGRRLDSLERELGNYRPGRWLWQLADPIPLSQPLRMSGRLGIYNIPLLYVLDPLTPGRTTMRKNS